MITDEERREVVKELRELAATGCILYAEEFYEELREIVAFDLDGSFDGVANSLADLIDRPTCRIVHDENRDCDVCTNCSTSFELAEFDYADANVFEGYSYCPKCGAKVVP